MTQTIKIKSIEIKALSLPLKHPFTTAFGTIKHKPIVIVKLVSEDGYIGYGEAATLHAPIYNHESIDSALSVIEKHIIPVVINKEYKNLGEYTKDVSYIKGNYIAKAAIDNALASVFAQKLNVPLYKYLGGVRNFVELGESIGMSDNVEDTLRDVGVALDKGYKRIKIKIMPGHDLELLEKIREEYPEIPLMVDANSSYSLEKDKETLLALDTFNLIMIEQPFRYDDLVEHANLQKMIKTPICLDESIDSYHSAWEAVQLKACRIVNIKQGRVGGLNTAIRINKLLKENGIKTWIGGMLETSIGKASCLALGTLENFTYPADSSPSSDYFDEDLLKNPIKMKSNCTVELSDETGIGYEVNEAVMKRYITYSRSINQFDL